MDNFIYTLLEQTPIVIILVLGIWYFTKQIEKKEAQFLKDREGFLNEIKELNKIHALEIKEINNYIRDEAKENADVFLKLALTFEDFLDK